MSSLIRMLGMKMSHNGTCRKCGQPRDKGNHSKCDRWPCGNGIGKGFHYVANSKETNLAEFKKMIALIAKGDADDTPVQFEIRIRQVI
jgi:hypothetical protein